METLDIEKHTFQTNERGERYLSIITVLCALLVIVFVGCLFIALLTLMDAFSLKYIAYAAIAIAFIMIIVLTLVSAWKAYHYASDTEVQIDPISRHFIYKHRRQTIEFNGDDVAEWYDDLGLKIGFGKLTRLTEHDSVLILQSGQVIYLHAWLWDGDHFWLHPGGDTYDNNIKFYLESHRVQLHLPECKMAWTYRYMMPKG